MTEKVFKINLWNLLGEWIAFIFTVSFIFFLIYTDDLKASDSTIKIAFYFFIILVFWGPFFHLLFNHILKSSGAQLKITADYVEFSQKGHSKTIKMVDINEIVIQSSTGKHSYRSLPWTDIFIWKIKSENSEIVVSNIIVSKSNLKKIFKNEFTYEKVFFPTL